MEIKQNTNNQEDVITVIHLKEFYYSIIKRWRWFLISIFCSLFIGIFYMLQSKPVFTRSASVLIKDSYSGTSVSSNLASFSELGLFQSNIDVNNEVIAFQSPVLMTEVVKQLKLDMNYYKKGLLRDNVLYGSNLPVNVLIYGIKDDDSLSFNLSIAKDSTVVISDLYTYENGEKINFNNDFVGILNNPIETPVGVVSIIPTAQLNFEDESLELKIKRSSIYSSVNAYKGKLSVELSAEKAAVINLIVNDNSLERADDILNTLIDVYNKSWIVDKNLVTKSTSQFINDRLVLIEKELNIVDEDISSFRSKNLLPDLNVASEIYLHRNEEASKRILEINNQLFMAKYLKSYLNDKSNKFKLLPSNTGIGSVNIESQINDYNKLLLQRNNLVANSSVDNPIVADLENSLSAMNMAVETSIENQIKTLKTNLESLEESEQATISKIAAGPGQAKYLINIERQQKVKEALYLYLLQKREENELSQAFTVNNTRIIATPNGERLPTSPVRNKILLISLLFGIMVPIAIILVSESLNTKVRDRKDIEKLTIPFVGEIPLCIVGKRKILKKIEPLGNKIIVEEGSRDVINEAFRVIRTNFDFITGNKHKCKVTIVTSFNPGSGKSFITMNLASSYAIKGKKVLVIDGDLRHASASAYVGLVKHGLSDYLAKRVDKVDDIIVTESKNKNLDVIPVGTIPPNPSELLMVEEFPALLEELKDKYDYIFVDCPPYDLVADTQIISGYADFTLFIIRTGLLERSMLMNLTEIYNSKKMNNMSLILNGTDNFKGQYGNHSSYYSSL